MNIFEKLIDELKEENLLEETVIETNGKYKSENKIPLPLEESAESDENLFAADEVEPENINNVSESSEENFDDISETGFEFKPAIIEETIPNDESDDYETADDLADKMPGSSEFFYRRAKEEVSSLQMVELILSGVERDQMKIIPKTFDDLAVKTALHKFSSIAGDSESTQHSPAEFELMQETENWYSALSQRDKNITVGHLRRFCETTRPTLSSQALLALARFYRNAPYSEPVRSKFDLIITRLLTKETSGDNRELVFGRDEIIKHLEGLYAEWSSVSLYSPDKDDSTILVTALKFEDFMSEADDAENFDDLIKRDFFNRLRAVKESTSENFFAPVITTAAIECNVRIGNRYVELLRAEDVNPEILIKKYGILREEAISDITGKTLQLAQLLNNAEEIAEAERQIEYNEIVKKQNKPKRKKTKIKPETTQKKSRFTINKWVIIAAIVIILGNIVLFVTSDESTSTEQTQAIIADKINLENSVLKEHLKSARMSNGVFFGEIAPSWNTLTQEDKEQFLQKIIASGKERGFNTVHLLDDENRSVAYADQNGVKVNEISP